jgi:hypothetical protein
VVEQWSSVARLMRRISSECLLRGLLGSTATSTGGCPASVDQGPVLDETGYSPGDEPPLTLDDGMGEGVFRLPLLGGRFSLLVGAPMATASGEPQAGLVSVFASEPRQGVVLHPYYHPVIVEGAKSSHCIEPDHRFAWESAPSRAFRTEPGVVQRRSRRGLPRLRQRCRRRGSARRRRQRHSRAISRVPELRELRQLTGQQHPRRRRTRHPVRRRDRRRRVRAG